MGGMFKSASVGKPGRRQSTLLTGDDGPANGPARPIIDRLPLREQADPTTRPSGPSVSQSAGNEGAEAARLGAPGRRHGTTVLTAGSNNLAPLQQAAMRRRRPPGGEGSRRKDPNDKKNERIPTPKPSDRDKVPDTEPDRRKPKAERPATIVRYKDGRLFLPLDKITGAPKTVPGEDKLIIEKDIASARELDPNLPNEGKDSAFATRSGKAENENFVVVRSDEQDAKGERKLHVLVDPITQEKLRVARKDMLILSREQVRAMGLSKFDTGRDVTLPELIGQQFRRERHEGMKRLLEKLRDRD